ncbi:MAG: TRAP transporter small permease [Alphaproteobacteria bacterium]
MAALGALYGRLLKVCGVISAVVILAMTALIVTDVALRNLAGVVIRGSVELTEYGLFLAAMLATPWLLREGRHIRIDVVLMRLPPRTGWICELVCDSIGIALSVMLARYSITATLRSAKAETVIVKDFIIPEWWVQWPLGFMFVLLSVEFIFRIHRLVTGPRRARIEGGSA